jgi:hypothetical protein
MNIDHMSIIPAEDMRKHHEEFRSQRREILINELMDLILASGTDFSKYDGERYRIQRKFLKKELGDDMCYGIANEFKKAGYIVLITRKTKYNTITIDWSGCAELKSEWNGYHYTQYIYWPVIRDESEC